MIKKSFIKAVISFVLIVTVVFCGSFSVFAYLPTIGIKSDDWDITSDGTFKEVYPNPYKGYISEDSPALSHEYLNGETYFGTTFWNDEGYSRITSADVSFPLISGEWWRSGDPYGNEAKHVIFQCGSSLFMAVFYNVNSVYITDKSVHNFIDLCFDVSGCDGEVDFYEIVYPYTSWSFLEAYDFYGSTDVVSFANFKTHDDVTILYTDVNVMNYKHDWVYMAGSTVSYTNFEYTVEFEKPVSVLEGKASFHIDELTWKKLEFGSFAFIVENMGFVCAMETGICSIVLNMTVSIDYVEQETYPLQIFSYDSLVDNETLEVGKDYIFNEINFLDVPGEFIDGITINLDYCFVTDSFNLFFPGNISFVEFQSYEDDMEHDEVMNAIDEAAGLIDGSIKNASSELSQEIVSAADNIISNSDENTSVVVNKLDESTKSVTDKLSDVGDQVENKLEDVKDGITEKLEDTKNGILDGIKSFFIPSDEAMEEIDKQWDELLKSRFGALYEVSDIITDFASQMNWDYIKQAGEKNTITMPSVTVKLVDTDFTFGGYEVSIVPDGFDVLTTALKGITSIVCTLLFVNALRRKYDKLVGGAAA